MKPERVKSNITSPKKSWSFTGNRLRILTRTNKTKGKKSDRGTAYEGQVPGLSDVGKYSFFEPPNYTPMRPDQCFPT